MLNAHIVSPSVVAVIILLPGQSAGVRKWSIDHLLVRGPSTLRPGIWSMSRSPLYVWIENPAMASTPKDTGLIGESISSLLGVGIVNLASVQPRLIISVFTPLFGGILDQSSIS